MSDAQHTLTTFPVAFPDEEEKGQVNQVLSSLFSKVRSRFGVAPGTLDTTSNSSPRNENAVASGSSNASITASNAASRNLRQGSNGSQTSSVPISFSRHDSEQSRSLLSSSTLDNDGKEILNSDPSSPVRSTHTIPPRSNVRNNPESSHTDSLLYNPTERLNSRPALPHTVSVRDPAPAVLSTTPVVRTHDYAIFENPEARSRRGSAASAHGTPFVQKHMKNVSTSSSNGINRLRRGSFGGLSTSPSSATLSVFGVDQLDFSAVPGFPIADDARSIRTDDGAKRNGSVSKIIRRLRGEGLRYVQLVATDHLLNEIPC